MNHNDYLPFKSFILRTPTFSYEALGEILGDKDKFIELLNNPVFVDAISIASPSLASSISNYQNEGNSKRGRIEESLTRYLERMSTRSTPFGLFSSVTIGHVSKNTKLQVNSLIEPHFRVDMQLMYELSLYLKNNKKLRKELLFFPNNTIYSLDDNTIHFISSKYKKGHIEYRLSSAHYSTYLKALIKKSAEGCTIHDGVSYLEMLNVDPESAESFINAAIDSNILVCESDFTVTGEPLFDKIIRVLSKINNNSEADSILAKLLEVQNNLKDYSYGSALSLSMKIGESFKDYSDRKLTENTIQVDSYRAGDVSIGDDVLEELSKVLRLYSKLARSKRNDVLEEFKKEFRARYGRESIPITEIFDSERGLGYPVNYGQYDYNDFSHSVQTLRKQKQKPISVDPFCKRLINKYLANKREIILSEEDINSIPKEASKLPESLAVIFQLLKNETDGVCLNNLRIVPSAINMLARFAYLDSKLYQFAQEITQQEESKSNDILADIVCTPDARIGNITARPHLRSYEILYFTDSDLPKNNVIPISDMYVSIVDNEVVLFSKRLNKRIYPKQTNAHNYVIQATPIYRFLCDLQNEGEQCILDMPVDVFMELFGHCPRIVYGKCILVPETWKVDISEISNILNYSDERILSVISDWRHKNGLPLSVYYPQGDNELFVDFSKLSSIRAFVSILKNVQTVVIKESIFYDNSYAVRDQMGLGYLNECVVPFYLSKYERA